MNFEDKDIDKIIARSLSGVASAREEKLLKDWIMSSDENYISYKVLQKSAEEGTTESGLLITNESFDKIWMESQQQKIHKPLHVGFKFLKTFAVSAASFLLILVSVFSYRQLVNRQNFTENSGQPALIEKYSPAGQKTRVFLPDGSSVWLNADSKLQYKTDFNDKNRTVWLTGEAYFTVKDVPAKPFIVKSGNVAISAHGTSFNVNTFFKNMGVEVVLDNGDLKLENLFSSLVPGMPLKVEVRPGQRAMYNLKDAAFHVQNLTNTYNYSCWKNGVLSFHNEDLESVINKLERWYGVQVDLKGSPLEKVSFSGNFNNEYLENVLKKLVELNGAEYKIRKNKVLLRFSDRN